MRYQLITRSLSVLAIVAAVGLSGAMPAKSADTQAGRYVLKETPDGFLRLDTRSGDVSMCSKAEGKWGCRSMDEDGGDVRDRIVELERENSRLKDKIAKLDEGGVGPTTQRRKFELPSDEEIDKAMTFVDKMLRRFKDALDNLKNDEEKGTQL